ncbi:MULTISPECIES: iron chaperone [unclassified Ornithinimicrobium]|uniref:iron chaperone n=1 Tax=unclassified Ornithinimicrobium TaxID=2615080 RepID=UPI0038529EA0
MAQTFATVEDYLATLPEDTRAVLRTIRETVLAVAPSGEDAISYGIPAVLVDGKALLYYAGYARHVSVYPVPEADEDLAAALAPYVAGKGTLRFTLDRPVPLELVTRVAERFLELRRG